MALLPLVRQLVEAKLNNYCNRKVLVDVRDQPRLGYKFRGNSVTLVESRSVSKDSEEWEESVIAQFRYEAERKSWTLYYPNSNERWRPYSQCVPSTNLNDLLKEVDEDPISIFWKQRVVPF
jgi:Protein of unknown function (DUF3024)